MLDIHGKGYSAILLDMVVQSETLPPLQMARRMR